MAAIEMLTADDARRIFREELERFRDLLANGDAVTVGEAARRLNLSVRTVQRRIKDGEIPSVKVGGAVRIPIAAVLPKAG